MTKVFALAVFCLSKIRFPSLSCATQKCVFICVSIRYGFHQAPCRTSSLHGASLNAVQGSESHRTDRAGCLHTERAAQGFQPPVQTVNARPKCPFGTFPARKSTPRNPAVPLFPRKRCSSHVSGFDFRQFRIPCRTVIIFRVSVTHGLHQAPSRTSSLCGASLNAVQGSESRWADRTGCLHTGRADPRLSAPAQTVNITQAA